jgi:Mrp family chromosome partitioning ATPase
MATDTTRHQQAEEKVSELLRMLDGAQVPPEQQPTFSLAAEAPASYAPVKPSPATWMLESPIVDQTLALETFTALHPACRGEALEEFRSIRTRVYLERKTWFDQGADLRVLAVVSPARRSGKSQVAANLAAVLAATGENRVLLIDANPASPAMGAHLGLTSQTGLCEVLQGEPWYQHLHRVEPASLFVMPFGATRANSVDSFDYTAMPVWLHDLRASFDWIILDGPSFETPSDAQLLTNFADASLLVVRKEEARYASVQESLRRIPRERLLGAVVTPALR